MPGVFFDHNRIPPRIGRGFIFMRWVLIAPLRKDLRLDRFDILRLNMDFSPVVLFTWSDNRPDLYAVPEFFCHL